ncbi:MAG: type IV secretion system protein VirB10 [Burkholderiaceae bacterium]|nr:type IV secretion system protein VirB10 [Burkholderiaceae bacterium]
MTEPAQDDDRLSPLPGEAGIPPVGSRPQRSWSRKGLLALGLLVGAVVAVIAVTVHHFAGSRTGEAEPHRRAGDRPAATTSEPRRLDLPATPPAPLAATAAPHAAASTPSPRVPAIEPSAEERADPIGVRRRGGGERGNTRELRPEDAPVMLVSTRPDPLPPPAEPSPYGLPPSDGTPSGAPADRNPIASTSRNLQAYQRQLQGLLDTLTRSTALATGAGTPPAGGLPTGALLGISPGGAPPAGGPGGTGAGALFGGQLTASATPRVAAGHLGNRSLTLPKGTAFTCALKTRVISATSGLVGCQVLRHVYSDDGRVLLIERGSHLDGEYRIGTVRPGMVRIPVLWTRIRTPLGVTVDIGSPGTGPLGESGIDGHVDNRWGERLGAAMLLSLIDDSVQLIIQQQVQDSGADTIVLPGTAATTGKLAEKVLESTINIPPLVYQNQGGVVGIYVARDVDFSSVYALEPVAR